MASLLGLASMLNSAARRNAGAMEQATFDSTRIDGEIEDGQLSADDTSSTDQVAGIPTRIPGYDYTDAETALRRTWRNHTQVIESPHPASRMLAMSHRRFSLDHRRSDNTIQHNLFSFFSWMIEAFAREAKDADSLDFERDVYQEAYEKMATGVEEWKRRALRSEDECAEARRAFCDSEELVKSMWAESEELVRAVQVERDLWMERTQLMRSSSALPLRG